MKIEIKNTPTNIITGFLGVGKTTVIKHLLAHKPREEKWAILVNEFGEVGLDGGFISSGKEDEQGIFVKEVPGGCMCCTSGLPMQIALNMLLAKAKPDRLLIEPTGLGHPKEVIQTLSKQPFQSTLNLQATITLVDARNITDPRYNTHATFLDQLGVADIIVANKTDLYLGQELKNLETFLCERNWSTKPVYAAESGVIPFELLQKRQKPCFTQDIHPLIELPLHRRLSTSNPQTSSEPLLPEIPECGFLNVDNEGEGFISSGWRFKPALTFNRERIIKLLNEIPAERVKAILITHDGLLGYNKSGDDVVEYEMDEATESRLEFISETLPEKLEEQLLSCVVS